MNTVHEIMETTSDHVYGLFVFSNVYDYIQTLTYAQLSNLDVNEYFCLQLSYLAVYDENDCTNLYNWLFHPQYRYDNVGFMRL
jgi:hypothetical protein